MSTFLQKLGFQSKAAKPADTGEMLPPVTIQYQQRLLRGNELDIKRLYEQSSVIQAAVNAWTSEFTSAQIKPYINEVPSDLEYLDLFNNQVMRDLLFAMLMSGTGMLYKIRSANGQLLKVQVLNGFNTSKVYNKDGEHTHWLYRTSRGEYHLEKDDVVPFPWFARDWVESNLGISPISSIMQQAEQMSALNTFITEQIQADGVPKTILSSPVGANYTPEQMKRMLEQIKEEFRANNGAIKILSGGWTISRLALGLGDLDISALRNIPESDIASSFRVPIEFLGTATGNANSTYANKETSRRQFVSNVVSSMWNAVEAIINEHFSYEFEPNPQWFFERNEVAALKEDMTAKFQRYMAMYQMNLISRRELRAELDLDDIDAGQDLYLNDILNQDPTFIA